VAEASNFSLEQSIYSGLALEVFGILPAELGSEQLKQ